MLETIVIVVLVLLLIVLLGGVYGSGLLLKQQKAENQALQDKVRKQEQHLRQLAGAATRMDRHKSAMSMGEVQIPRLRAHEVATNQSIDSLVSLAERIEIEMGYRPKRSVSPVPDEAFREVGEWRP